MTLALPAVTTFATPPKEPDAGAALRRPDATDGENEADPQVLRDAIEKGLRLQKELKVNSEHLKKAWAAAKRWNSGKKDLARNLSTLSKGVKKDQEAIAIVEAALAFNEAARAARQFVDEVIVELAAPKAEGGESRNLLADPADPADAAAFGSVDELVGLKPSKPAYSWSNLSKSREDARKLATECETALTAIKDALPREYPLDSDARTLKDATAPQASTASRTAQKRLEDDKKRLLAAIEEPDPRPKQLGDRARAQTACGGFREKSLTNFAKRHDKRGGELTSQLASLKKQLDAGADEEDDNLPPTSDEDDESSASGDGASAGSFFVTALTALFFALVAAVVVWILMARKLGGQTEKLDEGLSRKLRDQTKKVEGRLRQVEDAISALQNTSHAASQAPTEGPSARGRGGHSTRYRSTSSPGFHQAQLRQLPQKSDEAARGDARKAYDYAQKVEQETPSIIQRKLDNYNDGQIDKLEQLTYIAKQQADEEAEQARDAMTAQQTGPLADCLYIFWQLRDERLMEKTLDSHALAVLGPKVALLNPGGDIPPLQLEDPRRSLARAIDNLVRAHAYRTARLAEVDRQRAALQGAFSPDQDRFMAFIRSAVRAFDPDGDHCARTNTQYSRDVEACLALSRTLGMELIYPRPGEPMATDRMDMAGLDSAPGIAKNHVIRVESPGYRSRDGQVRQKARVKVGR